LWRGYLQRHSHQPPTDDGLGRQRGLRALLESAVENVSLRRIRPDELQLASQCTPLQRVWCWHWTGHQRGGNPWLRHELDPVVDRFPNSVERDEGLLYGSRRGLCEV